MSFHKQLDAAHEGFVKGVRATLQYQFNDVNIEITKDQFHRAIRTVLEANGWSEAAIVHWTEKTE